MYRNNLGQDIPLNKIIAVTNRKLCKIPFLQQLERICSLHPKALLLREKDLSEQDYLALARELISICNRYQVDCILHNFPAAAMALRVKQIHLPLHKLENITSRELSSFSVVGSSIHSVEEAVRAQRLGATYVTAGHIYSTDCKKGLPPRGLNFLKSVCDSVTIPVYAIGGMKLNQTQIKEVELQGASGVCIMSEMMAI